jgi:hypothetical protein
MSRRPNMRVVEHGEEVPDVSASGTWTGPALAVVTALATAAAGWLGSHFGLVSQDDMTKAITKQGAEVSARLDKANERLNALELHQLSTVDLIQLRKFLEDQQTKPPKRGTRAR